MSKKAPIPQSPTWLTVIDGWVRDPKIRLDALIALAMTLAAAAITVAIASGAAGTAMDALLPSVLSKFVAGSVVTGTGCTWVWWQRRKRHKSTAAEELPLASHHPGVSTLGAGDGNADPHEDESAAA